MLNFLIVTILINDLLQKNLPESLQVLKVMKVLKVLKNQARGFPKTPQGVFVHGHAVRAINKLSSVASL